MSMNNSDFPLVWMSFTREPGHDHEQDYADFEANLQREEAFVILTDTVPEENHEHSPEEKKRTALWMKKHKDQLRKLVLAMVVVEPNSAKRLGFKAFSVVFAKFWGYPLLLASSREQAEQMARELLAENVKSSA
ncbi:hypothetical protein [Herbaspirillum rubrisubalbicans]|uniref:ATP--cob(I)alamin adenosyltransferase n=1 Tax=Herbaspirillum rubrisubalbicans TaxID=80842 RepID=A0AAD0UC53_9BURK|nr:hypothetical protein [Herbaspirillum rubrisubalbicans]ALU91550.1 hypothetical protein Hrubri_4405 [Herbaspirillum rubrisubalbicans M1]AYR27089.1 hypothetical protein RC54_23080 [Herbaspirillum rubrisubalbicans]